jgi:hypothetical protein
VKVTVIRESRAVDVARNHAAVQNGNGTTLDSILEDEPHPPIQAA